MEPPEHLMDDDLMIAMSNIKQAQLSLSLPVSHVKYLPSVGLLLKLLKGTKRLWKRGKIPLPSDEGVEYLTLFWIYYAVPTYDHDYWSADRLFQTANDVNRLCREISPAILRDLDKHLLIPPQNNQDVIYFEPQFLLKVANYHKSLERPPETFSTDKILIEDSTKLTRYLNRIQQLSEFPREKCPKCGGKRQIYCGDCLGIRMPEASHLLPPRLTLPVDIALLLHWRESLHKCTGIHVGVLCVEGSIECIPWPKEDEEQDTQPMWEEIVRQFDSSRDVLLFPYDHAVSSDVFPWNSHGTDAVEREDETPSQRKRLIVLEGSWEGAKTMAHRITSLRQKLSLPPLPAVTLPENITSHYWRLQHMGSGAVSTIEAIAHLISSIEKRNGTEEPEQKRCRYESEGEGEGELEQSQRELGTSTDVLLLLFNLQRHRMLSSVKNGAKVPMAIAASNNSGYSTAWKDILERSAPPLPPIELEKPET